MLLSIRSFPGFPDADFGYHTAMITVRMLFFAHLQDVARAHEITVALPSGATVGDAAEMLAARAAGLENLLAHTRVAVNAEFADADTVLSENDEVAWMPPMSGGAQ